MGKQIAEIKASEENAEKHQKKEAAYFYWKYDDGRYILCGTKAKNMLPATMITKAELKEKKRGKGKFKKLRIENGFLDGLTGTEMLNYRKDDVSELSEAFSDIKQLVEDYALEVKSTEVLRLFTYILSGYTYRLFMKDFGKRAMFSFRAPVVLITPSKKDFSGGFEHLENLMECFSYDTSLDHNLIHTNPAVLPDNYLATTITECAYMQIRDNEKLGLFPAQYRDTTVLLHSSFFKKSDLVEFVKRNVWASVLIFGGPVPKLTFTCFGIDLNLMNLSKRNWDSEESEQIKKRINDLISSFSIWIHGISCTSDAYLRMLRWMDTGNLAVRKYNLATHESCFPINKRIFRLSAALVSTTLDAVIVSKETDISRRTQDTLAPPISFPLSGGLGTFTL